MGQAIAVAGFTGGVALNQQGIIDGQQCLDERWELEGLQVLLITIEFIGQRQGLGRQQIGLRCFIELKKADIFLVLRWDGVLDKQYEKGILAFIFDIRNPGARF